MNIYKGFLLFGYLAFTMLVFQGLIGAIQKNFKFATSKWSPPKNYKGANAFKWGMVFFLGFGIMATFIAIVLIKLSVNKLDTGMVMVGCTVFGFYLASMSRKIGLYRVTKAY